MSLFSILFLTVICLQLFSKVIKEYNIDGNYRNRCKVVAFSSKMSPRNIKVSQLLIVWERRREF